MSDINSERDYYLNWELRSKEEYSMLLRQLQSEEERLAAWYRSYKGKGGSNASQYESEALSKLHEWRELMEDFYTKNDPLYEQLPDT